MTEATTSKTQKTFQGVVVSDAMNKTVVVKISSLVKHTRLKKYIRSDAKFCVHDDKNEAKKGDLVRFVGTRPISKRKAFVLQEIVQAAR